ncbi:hypothetical protein ACS0TY_027191 [Phlomoides rotata]
MKRAHMNRKCSLPIIFVSISALIMIFILILSHLKPSNSSFPNSTSVDSDSLALPELPRFAYFISGTSGDSGRLKRLLQALYHPRNYYLLHLDLETSEAERLELAKYVKSKAVIRGFKNVMGKGDLVISKGPTVMASTLHAIGILLKQGKRWDWFLNLGASDYPLMPQDAIIRAFWRQQRARPIIIDPGLYHSKKSGVFWAKREKVIACFFQVIHRFRVGSSFETISRVLHLGLG